MEYVRTRSLNKGEKLFHEKDASTEIYFLRVGTLLLLKGDILIGQVKPTCFVGGLGPILGSSRVASVIAKTPASMDVYNGKEMMSKLTLQSELGSKFLRSLNERFDMIRERVNDYQYQYLEECMNVLAVHVSEKRIIEKKLPFSDIKLVRREVEVAFSQLLTRKDAVEDSAALSRMAGQHSVKEKYEKSVATRFRTFSPMDLKPYKIPRIDTFTDFRAAALSIAEKSVTLIRHLSDHQNLGLSRLGSEVSLIEETMPFAMREQILKELMLGKYAKGSLDEFKRTVTEFDRTVKALAEEGGQTELVLCPIAKKFGLDEQYMKALQAKWKEFLTK